MSTRPSGRALLLAAVVAAVVAVVLTAVLVLDSPAQERRKRLDQQRIEDLTAIADGIDAYREKEGTLPADLDALAAWQGFDGPRTDPQTGAPYRYRTTGETTYELCATFSTDRQTTAPGDALPHWLNHGIYWNHPAGDHCFSLESEASDD